MSPTKVPQLAGSRAETQISPPPGPSPTCWGPSPCLRRWGKKRRLTGAPQEYGLGSRSPLSRSPWPWREA